MKLAVASFLAPDPKSLQGFLNVAELFKILTSSTVVSAIVGVVMLVIQAVVANLPAIVPNPAVAMLISFALTQLLDTLRRLGHGDPTPAPAPAPAK